MANQIYIFDQFGDIERLSENDLPLKIKVARGSSYALWSLSKSRKNKIYIQKSGGLSLLVHLVRTRNISVIIPAIGTLQVLLQQEFFFGDFQTSLCIFLLSILFLLPFRNAQVKKVTAWLCKKKA